MISELKPYLEYKDSGLAWLGRVPTHWEVRRNARIFAQRNETGFPELPILEVSLKTGVRIRNFEDSNRKQVMSNPEKYKRAAMNDIAYNMMRMWQGAVGVVPVDGLVSPAYVVARPFQETESRYYNYLFRTASYMNEVNKYSHGIVTDRNRLYWDEFKQMPSAFPSLGEQRKIADFLDYHNFIVRRFIRAKLRLIELLGEQKQAIIHRAVTRGLDPKVNFKPSGIEWLGDIPENWEMRPAKYYFREIDERSLSGKEELLSVSHITGVTPRSQKNVTMFMAASYVGHKCCEVGDLVINTMWAWMAALGIAKQNGIVSPSYAVYRPINSDAFVAEFIDNLLRTKPYAAEYLCRSTGIRSSRLRLYPEEFLQIPLIQPSLDVQKQIKSFIKRETFQLESSIVRTRHEIDLIREYRTRLISDVVTGKLDVRGVTLPAAEETEVPDESNGTLEPEADVIEDLELPEVVQEEVD